MKNVWEKASAEVIYLATSDIITDSPLPEEPKDDTGNDIFPPLA